MYEIDVNFKNNIDDSVVIYSEVKDYCLICDASVLLINKNQSEIYINLNEIKTLVVKRIK